MSTRLPKYRLHKASGQALVQINGERIYLGKHGSEASHEKYRRLVAELLASADSQLPLAASSTATEISVNELILAYWRFAEGYYVSDGKPTSELWGMRDALRPLKNHFGQSPANKFGPKSLKLIWQELVNADLCRGVVNKHIGRIRRVFKWAVAEELVESSIYRGLQAVGGLRRGRSSARESTPVKPVPDLHICLVLPFVAPQVATMVLVQRISGMRAGELVVMRSGNIDTSHDVWTYVPERHKGTWRGQSREIPLGPIVQQLLQPFLNRPADSFLFSPKEAELWRRDRRAHSAKHQRRTPVYPSEMRRREKAKKDSRLRTPKRPKRDHYYFASFRRAITYGIRQARRAGIMVPHWHPHQLRHSRATEIRRGHGIEAAQCLLGHRSVAVTATYAERDMEVAVRIARQSG